VGILMQSIVYRTLLCTTLVVSSLILSNANAKIIVVANTDDAIQLTRQEVKALFMGGAVSHNLKAVALKPKHKSRMQFNASVIGLTESRVQSYWAQMRFSGKSKPPQELESEQAVLEYLQNHKGAASYIDESMVDNLPSELKVIYQVE
jgi:hypothetical protein